MSEKPESFALSTESAPVTESSSKQDVVDVSSFVERNISPTIPDITSGPVGEPAGELPQEDESWFGSLFDDDDENETERQRREARSLPHKNQFKTAWKVAKNSRDPIAAQVLVSDAYSTKPVELERVEEESELVPVSGESKTVKDKYSAFGSYAVDKVVKAGGTALGSLEAFDVLKSELWTNVYRGASFLPDSDTFVGDALGDLFGKGLSLYVKKEDFLNSGPGAFESEDSKEQYYKDLEVLGQELYSAFADEKLLDKALNTPGYFIERPSFGPLSGANAAGEDLVNIALPIETMKRLYNNAPDGSAAKLKLKTLSNPIGRMGVGLALDVTLDPLWFFGPAKGAQIVSVGSRAYLMGSKAQKAASILEKYSGVTGSGPLHQKSVVKAITGSPEQVNKSRTTMLEVADNAKMEAIAARNKAKRFTDLRALVDEGGSVEEALAVLRKELADDVEELLKLADRYADPASGRKAKADYAKVNQTIQSVRADIDLLSSTTDTKRIRKMLLNKEAQYINTSLAHTSASSTLREFVDLLKVTSPKKLGVVEKSKVPLFGTFHYADQTYTFGTGAQVEQVGKKVNQLLGQDSIILAGAGKVKDAYRAITPSTIAQKKQLARMAGVDPISELSEPQKLFEALYNNGATRLLSSAPAYTIDLFGRVLGTRRFQPYFASENLKQNMRYYGASQAMSVGLTASESSLVRLKRIRPELWENYETATNNLFKKVSFLEEYLKNQTSLIYTLAGGTDGTGGALKEWKKSIETREVPLLQDEIAALKSDLATQTDPSLSMKLKRELRYKESKLEEAQQVLSDDYTVLDFVNEAVNLIETGAGRVEQNPWLKAVSEQWAPFRDELASRLKKETDEIDQALIAMLRFMSGDKEKAEAFARRMMVLEQTSRGVKPEDIQSLNMEEIASALNIKLKSMDELLNSLDPNKLTEVVYRTLDIGERMPFGREQDQAIYNALLKALDGDEALADEILMYAGGTYGGSPEQALMLFSMDVSGELKRVANDANTLPSKLTQSDAQLFEGGGGGAHPRRKGMHQNERPHSDNGIPSELSAVEFVHFSKNKDKEYAAVYDAENGMQVASAVGTERSVNPLQELSIWFVDDLIAQGSTVTIHNHPNTPVLEDVLAKIGDKVLDAENYRHHETRTHMSFSLSDVLGSILMNEKRSIVVNPDGTMWMIDRPRGGWNFNGADPSTLTYEAREAAVKNKDFLERYRENMSKIYEEASKHVEDDIINFGDQLDDLKKSFDAGEIDKRRYTELKKSVTENHAQFILSKAQQKLNDLRLDFYEETFGSRPYRVAQPGRFSGTAPISRFQQGDSFTVERAIIKNRIRKSIQDKKLETQTKLQEIRNYRLGVLEPESFVHDSHSIAQQILIKKLQIKQKIEKMVFDKYSVSDLDDIPYIADDFVEEFRHWIDTDYPNGIPLDTSAKKARTPAEWREEKLERLDLEDFTVDEIKELMDDFISIRNMDAAVAERYQLLTGVEKKLGNRQLGQTFDRSKLRKDAKKLKQKRINQSVLRILDEAPDDEAARIRVRELLDESMDLPPGDFYDRVKVELADTLVKRMSLKKPKLADATDKAKKRTRVLFKDELKDLGEQLKQEIPRLEIPNVKPGEEDFVVYLKDWELEVFDKFKSVFGSLSEEDGFLVAFAALADTPKVPGTSDLFIAMQERYKSLLGRRMGKIPEEMKPTVEALKSLIKHYEDLYVKYGMDLAKSPVDMLRFWGVVDYVPHKKLNYDELTGYSGMVVDLTRRKSSLEDSIGASMPSRKQRLLGGTMAEINASGKPFAMGITPQNLVTNYMKASREVAGHEFILTMLAGDVIKPITSKPAYEHQVELIAQKYNLLGDTPIDEIDPKVLESLVRAKASKTDIEVLDSILARSTDDFVEMIPAYQRAIDLGYVPIFDRAVKGLSNDIIINGKKSDWGQYIDEDILKQFDEIESFPEKVRQDRFAKYIRETPAIKASDEIIALITKIKARDYKLGDELYDPISMHQKFLVEEKKRKSVVLRKRGKTEEQIQEFLEKEADRMSFKAWSLVKDDMNKQAAKMGSSLRVSDTESLKTFYGQDSGIFELYVPATVKQSMDEILFAESSIDKLVAAGGKTGAFIGWPLKKLRDINSFWKIRTTIVGAAFHVRNFVSNQFSQILDSNVATMSPEVACTAGKLATLSNVVARYGTIATAKKVMSLPRGSTESAYQYKKRQIGRKILDELDQPDAVYDLGDGVFRSADEAIKELQERGVIAGGMQQYLDVNAFETAMGEVFDSATKPSIYKTARKWGNIFEDTLVTGVPFLISGATVPIGLPKNVGSVVGRNIENQARISTFIVNARKTGSFDTAAQRVDKFLFDYDDLTPFQKDWMRLIFPFFTWTSKNVALQIQMMRDNPVFYSQMQRLMIHQGPDLVQKYNSETLGIPFEPKTSSSRYELAFRDEHTRNMIRFPLPGRPGYYIEGLGLPQEQFFEQMKIFKQTAGIAKPERFDKRKEHLRLLGQTHWMFKTFMELGVLKHNTFMDMPISEATNGRRAMQVIDGVRKIPLIGNGVADYVITEGGITSTQPWNGAKGGAMDDVHIRGTTNYMIANHPWARVLNDAAGVAMLYNMTYLDRLPAQMRLEYSTSEYEPIPSWFKIADAMGGIRIIADNPEARRARKQYEIQQRYQEAFRQAGITGGFEIQTVKDQQ